MTHDQWIKLTPKEQRIKVAKLCGWKKSQDGYWFKGFDKLGINSKTSTFVLPDYLNDLNAMHEVEQAKLNDNVLWHGYCNVLWDVVCPQFEQMSGLNAAVALLLLSATAAQRAEAFVITMENVNESI